MLSAGRYGCNVSTPLYGLTRPPGLPPDQSQQSVGIYPDDSLHQDSTHQPGQRCERANLPPRACCYIEEPRKRSLDGGDMKPNHDTRLRPSTPGDHHCTSRRPTSDWPLIIQLTEVGPEPLHTARTATHSHALLFLCARTPGKKKPPEPTSRRPSHVESRSNGFRFLGWQLCFQPQVRAMLSSASTGPPLFRSCYLVPRSDAGIPILAPDQNTIEWARRLGGCIEPGKAGRVFVSSPAWPTT